MAHYRVANRDVRNLAIRAEIPAMPVGLVPGRQDDTEADLRETTPAVFHDVAVDQGALRVFQLEEILDGKWISVRSTNISRLALHPGQRLEHVVAPNLDIARCERCLAPTE